MACGYLILVLMSQACDFGQPFADAIIPALPITD